MPLSRRSVLPLIMAALREDAAANDVTSRAVIPATTRIRAVIVAKASGIVAGVPIAFWTFEAVDPSLRCLLLLHKPGQRVKPGERILMLEGRARSIFAAERVALNFIGHLSGIATLTAAFVRRARGTRACIYDTRKTLPGLRALDKDAVRAGGGHNHRSGLSDAILIKTNHLRALGGRRAIPQAVAKAKRARPRKFVEIEVTNLSELKRALAARPDAILLDNWRLPDIRKAVALRRGRKPLLEVSGGVTLANVRAIARAGVERIAIGRLTHSAPALDVSLQVI